MPAVPEKVALGSEVLLKLPLGVVSVGLTIDQLPVPTVGVLAARVAEVPVSVWSGPALAEVGGVSTVSFTTFEGTEGAQAPPTTTWYRVPFIEVFTLASDKLAVVAPLMGAQVVPFVLYCH